MQDDELFHSKLEVRLSHTLSAGDDSILSLTSDNKSLFVGQGKVILVYCLATWSLECTLKGHLGSVLGLVKIRSDNLLCSCSSDNTIRLWDLESAKCLYVFTSPHNIGDILCMKWSERWNRLYFGCQDTSIGWTSLDSQHLKANVRLVNLNQRSNRFFSGVDACSSLQYEKGTGVEVARDDTIRHAHQGYVYCLLITRDHLLSGGGDGSIKIWKSDQSGLSPYKVVQTTGLVGVLSMAFHQAHTLLVGSQGGAITVYDHETLQKIRDLHEDASDTLALVSTFDSFYSAHASGTLVKWSNRFELVTSLKAHQAPILDAVCVNRSDAQDEVASHVLVTGGGRRDPVCKIWLDPTHVQSSLAGTGTIGSFKSIKNDDLCHLLQQFVSFRSVSGSLEHREDCRRCALFLKSTLNHLGGEVKIIAGEEDRNPVVVARFAAKTLKPKSSRPKHFLFYGHYDVIEATADWTTEPFSLIGKDGYLYGRGVSDNKGPILAAVTSVTRLRDQSELDFDVTFVLEGEEESGSRGLAKAVASCRDWIAPLDMILVSNSYWKNDSDPCLTYGLRGVIKATIAVSSSGVDRHSGVDGASTNPEALSDLVNSMARLRDDNGMLKIKGFYDQIREVTDAEKELYRPLERIGNDGEIETVQALMAKWRFPAFTMHKIEVSGPGSSTIIPSWARATVSLRLVPDQDIEYVKANFVQAVQQAFDSIKSVNSLTVSIDYSAEWWLGNPSSHYYRAAGCAIESVWGQKPLFVREGGTIPAMRLLERQFGAPCVHIPLGKRSDNAHLPNERMCLDNLFKGVEVFTQFLKIAANQDLEDDFRPGFS